MNKAEVDELSANINNIKDRISEKLNQFPVIPRVIIIGLTGSAKTSLALCLTKKELNISEGNGKKVEVKGEGIQSGSSSITRDPNIIVDQDEKIIYCDCPGFEDTHGFEQEIINSYAIDQLFQQVNNERCHIKVLLTVLCSETDTGRCNSILKSIERLTRIFPNIDEIRRKMGIVFTKSEKDITGIDYLHRIQENSNETLNEWCNYFIENDQQVFEFPAALRKNIGQQYTEFEDKHRLIEFLQADHLINPTHNVGLSEKALIQLREIGNKQMASALQNTNELFKLVTQIYLNQNKEETLQKWLDLMHNLLQNGFNNVSDFIKIMKENNFNNDNFNQYYSKLQNSETLNIFIGNVLNEESIRNCVCNSIQSHLNSIIQELANFLQLLHTVNDQQNQIDKHTKSLFLVGAASCIGGVALSFLLGNSSPKIIELLFKEEVLRKITEIIRMVQSTNS